LTHAEIQELRPLTDANGKRFRGPVKVVVESDAEWEKRTRRPGERGKQVAPTKKLVSLRLSAGVLEYFRATGPGWQTRIDERLKRAVKPAAGSPRKGRMKNFGPQQAQNADRRDVPCPHRQALQGGRASL
jgi:uncharacterized protein (DUF4415 family)